MRSKYSFKGFTLIEVLLGLSIFSIIAVSLYGTLDSALRLSRRSDDVNGIYREARWALDQIAGDLERMRAFNFANSYPKLTAFSGNSDKISFVSATDTGLKVISYYLELPDQTTVHKVVIGGHTNKNRSLTVRYEEKFVLYSLVREEKLFTDYLTDNAQAKVEKDILSPHIQEGSLSFSFAYLEGQEEDEKITWKDSWEKPYTPSGVRIKATFIKPGKVKQPIVFTKDVYIPSGYLTEENL
ncbi:MAG TPA: prepilin-type N-terminal cleavage/methylation domain-containing protein [Candidatus Omnitrophota bacterium]|nr:prepilin-type N-terminal cleavage/methylation domain-containing protein [Candidatus Omnitrophota bacterium]HPD84694.1 prepilin-type N-terminal cleavage/methylation domain-containing protein [Candidatus Omnitrophota bacterium]HRZ03552.1 prepilin-type N-terminal cleavage/methylation domain-containing protein [Candidatus Omnitrophota bacterium]